MSGGLLEMGSEMYVGDGPRHGTFGLSGLRRHEPIDLVNPIIKLQVFCGFSIFISRLLRLSGEAIGAMLNTGDVNKGEVEQQDGDDPTIHAGGQGEVGIC